MRLQKNAEKCTQSSIRWYDRKAREQEKWGRKSKQERKRSIEFTKRIVMYLLYRIIKIPAICAILNIAHEKQLPMHFMYDQNGKWMVFGALKTQMNSAEEKTSFIELWHFASFLIRWSNFRMEAALSMYYMIFVRCIDCHGKYIYLCKIHSEQRIKAQVFVCQSTLTK